MSRGAVLSPPTQLLLRVGECLTNMEAGTERMDAEVYQASSRLGRKLIKFMRDSNKAVELDATFQRFPSLQDLDGLAGDHFAPNPLTANLKKQPPAGGSVFTGDVPELP